MTTLYNCHHDGDQYRITKFNELGEPESSYLCTTDECDCPAGVRPTCRHRQMLPKFLAREAVDSYWFYDFDRGGWVTNEPANRRFDGAITDRWVSDGKHIEEIAPEGLTVDTDDYGEDPIGLESLPPARPAWRRI